MAPAAAALEVFHNFTLVHDDLMDRSPLRRGAPSVPAKFGETAAVLSGDLMLVDSYNMLLRLPEELVIAAINLFNQAAEEVCRGQQLDMDYEKEDAISLSQYIEVVELKTAALLSCCLSLGSLALKQKDEESHALFYQVGKAAGIAFQIQDDLLDAYGASSKIGKLAGNDIKTGKKTILFALAYAEADPKMQSQLVSLYLKAEEEDIREPVLNIFNKLSIEEKAIQVRDEYIRIAEEALHKLNQGGYNVDSLSPIVQALALRDY